MQEIVFHANTLIIKSFEAHAASLFYLKKKSVLI